MRLSCFLPLCSPLSLSAPPLWGGPHPPHIHVPYHPTPPVRRVQRVVGHKVSRATVQTQLVRRTGGRGGMFRRVRPGVYTLPPRAKAA